MKRLLIILLILGIHGPAYAFNDKIFYCTREGDISIINYIKFDEDYVYWQYGYEYYQSDEGRKDWLVRIKASVTSHNLIAEGENTEWLNFEENRYYPASDSYNNWKFYFDFKSKIFLQQDRTTLVDIKNYKNNCTEIKKKDLPK